MPSHKDICSCHAAHSQDADHNAEEMHSLVPDQQEEPGEQNHHRDHKAVQELQGRGEVNNNGRFRGKLPRNKEKSFSPVEKVFPLKLSFCADPERIQLKRLRNKHNLTFT